MDPSNRAVECTPLKASCLSSRSYSDLESTGHSLSDSDKETNSVVQHVIHKGSIGTLGGVAMAVNSLIGPAMLDLPSTYQRSGFIPTTLTLILTCLISAVSSLVMANVISLIPGNDRFQKKVEFSDSFRIFWGNRSFVFTQVFFFGCVTCLNIASIVYISQVLDSIISQCLHYTIALKLTLNGKTNILQTTKWNQGDDCSPYELVERLCFPFRDNTNSFILTAGYVLSGLIFIPMCLMDLDDNIRFQIVGLFFFLIICAQFLVTFATGDIDVTNVPLWGDDCHNLFGVILFNFSLVIAIPAFCHEKRKDVSIQKVVLQSSVIVAVTYISIGYLGAISIYKMSDNMLESMMSGAFGMTTQVTSEIFALFMIGFGIPISSVIVRLNLTTNERISSSMGILLSVTFPWSISWMFYSGSFITDLLGWGGIIFTGIVSFFCPMSLALYTASKVGFKGFSLLQLPFLTSSPKSQVIFLFVVMSSTVVIVIVAIMTKLSG